jgi:hydroxymethylpyrimidine/phosphomethylpyrimidine kinase
LTVRALITIAGGAPTSGAGVTADLHVFRDFGFHGLWTLTAAIDQDTQSVSQIVPIEPLFISHTLKRLLSIEGVLGIKIGLLPTVESVLAVAHILASCVDIPVVFDPVLENERGDNLTEKGVHEVILSELLPCCTVVTPNIKETRILTSIEVHDLESAQRAGTVLREKGVKAALIKGGHLPRAAGDVLVSENGHKWYENKEKYPASVHGTGCHLSSALLACIVSGLTLERAVMSAKGYLNRCVAHAKQFSFPGEDRRSRPVVIHGPETVEAARTVLSGEGMG